MSAEPPLRRRVVYLGGLFEAGLGLLACLIGWLVGVPVWEHLRGEIVDVAIGVVASAPMLFVFALCLRWPIGPLARIKAFCDEVVRPLFASCSLLDLAFLSLLAGIGEEMLFRGLLQEVVSSRSSPWIGLGLASIVFGLMHPITPGYVTLATLLGAYLGLLWWYTGSLVAPIIAHAGYDFVALVVIVKGPRPT